MQCADRLQSNGNGRAFPCKVQIIRVIIVQASGLHYHNMLHGDVAGVTDELHYLDDKMAMSFARLLS